MCVWVNKVELLCYHRCGSLFSDLSQSKTKDPIKNKSTKYTLSMPLRVAYLYLVAQKKTRHGVAMFRVLQTQILCFKKFARRGCYGVDMVRGNRSW